MLRFFALLTGDRYVVLNQHGPASRKKVVAMGMGLLLASCLWLLSGYNLGANVLGFAPLTAIGFGCVVGGLVFAMDRIIILSVGRSLSLVVLRIVLASLLAIVGGTALDLVAFRSEIDQTLVEIHQEKTQELAAGLDAKHGSALANARAEVMLARQALTGAEQDWKDELNGSPSGSGRYGEGAVAKAKERLVQERQASVEAAVLHLKDLEADLNGAKQESTARIAKAQATPGLIERIHALHRYISSDRAVLVGYILITLILIGFELSPLIAKMACDTTAYEAELALADQIQRERVQAIARNQLVFHARQAALSARELDALATLRAVASSHHGMN